MVVCVKWDLSIYVCGSGWFSCVDCILLSLSPSVSCPLSHTHTLLTLINVILLTLTPRPSPLPLLAHLTPLIPTSHASSHPNPPPFSPRPTHYPSSDIGQSTLGFVNPALYAGSAFFSNDITSGANNCVASSYSPCCTQGMSFLVH